MAGTSASGLTISSGGSQVSGFTIQNFNGDGVRLTTSGNNLVTSNTISLNGGAGVAVLSGNGNTISNNQINSNGGAGVAVLSGSGNAISQNNLSSNGGLGIDLGQAGPQANDTDERDTGANELQNYPVLLQPTPVNGMINLSGRLNSAPNTIA